MMHLRSKALDCLYVNWALPVASAPPLPGPLRYELHRWQGQDWVFASALLFRLSGLHLESVPFLRLSYPQMSLRLYVIDEDDVPAVLFRRMLVPFWVVPMSRLLGRQPATGARFSYPTPSRDPESGSWRWAIRRLKAFEVAGRLGAPQLGPGPSLGSWERTVGYFRHRLRGYVEEENRLRSLTTANPSVEVLPLAVEMRDVALIAEILPDVGADVLRAPHSAWLCPEIPFLFELGAPLRLTLLRRQVPAAEGCR